MGLESEFKLFIDPPHLPRWLTVAEQENRLALIDVDQSKVDDSSLYLTLMATIQAKTHGSGYIGVRSGMFNVYATDGEIHGATDFKEGARVESEISETHTTKRKLELCPEITAGMEGGPEFTGKIGKLALGGKKTKIASSKFSFEEGPIVKTHSKNHVRWTITTAQGTHPYQQFLNRTLSLDVTLGFGDKEKCGKLKTQLTSPEYFNGKGKVRPKIFALLACWMKNVKWNDSMDFRIGSAKKE